MSDEEILAALTEIAREQLGFAGTLAAEMRLVDELQLDSMRLLTLAMEVEHRFDVSFDGAESGSIERVGDLVRAIAERLAARR